MKAFDQLSAQLADRLSAASEKTRYMFLAGVFFFICLFNFFVFLLPELRNYSKLSPQIAELTKNLHEARTNIKATEEYRAKTSQLRTQAKATGGRILFREEIPAILEAVSRIANESKVQINQIMPIKELQQLVLTKDDGKYYSLPILVNARAGYHNVGRFFNRLENAEIFMSIVDFDIAANSDDPLMHSFKVTIKTFVREKVASKETKGKK